MRHVSHHQRPAKQGFVLVTVLWVLALLAVITLGFGRRAMLERQAAWYALDREQAQHMARGAVEHAIVQLRSKNQLDALYQQKDYTGPNQYWAHPIDLMATPEFYAIASDERFADDVCEYRIYDNESRISLNYGSEALLESIESIGMRTMENILARRDSGGYNDQPWLFQSVDELRTMEEISDAQWYGEIPGTGLRDLFTVWGQPGGTRININTASETVLQSIPAIDPCLATDHVAYRKGPDGLLGTQDDLNFRNVREVVAALGARGARLQPLNVYCKTVSSSFTIVGHATRRGGKINAYCTATVEVHGRRLSILEWREDAVES